MFNLKKFWEFTAQPLNVSRETFVEPTLLDLQLSIKSKLDSMKRADKRIYDKFCDTQIYKNRVAANGKL